MCLILHSCYEMVHNIQHLIHKTSALHTVQIQLRKHLGRRVTENTFVTYTKVGLYHLALSPQVW